MITTNKEFYSFIWVNGGRWEKIQLPYRGNEDAFCYADLDRYARDEADRAAKSLLGKTFKFSNFGGFFFLINTARIEEENPEEVMEILSATN